MTILEISSKLLEWFKIHDSFELKADYEKLLPLHVSETPNADKATVLLGLEELVLANAIKKTTLNKTDFYVLLRPFDQMTQTITLNAGTCLAITDIIKKAAEQLDRKDILINPLNFTENDIITAIGLLMEAANLQLDNKENN